MPELPDVEGFRRSFARYGAGKVVRGVRVDGSIVRNVSPASLRRALRGRRLGEPRRHGKWLTCPADGPLVLLHFGMTGDVIWGGDDHRHDRLVLALEDGKLRYRNMRKFGGVWLARDEDEARALLAPLGPDAADVDRRTFDQILSRRRGALKPVLMDQRVLAGLGNLTVDETLWRARLSPKRPVPSLTDDERARLFRSMSRLLRRTIPLGFVPNTRGWLTGSRSRGDPCPRCGAPLRRATIGGRTTIWCPRCQR